MSRLNLLFKNASKPTLDATNQDINQENCYN